MDLGPLPCSRIGLDDIARDAALRVDRNLLARASRERPPAAVDRDRALAHAQPKRAARDLQFELRADVARGAGRRHDLEPGCARTRAAVDVNRAAADVQPSWRVQHHFRFSVEPERSAAGERERDAPARERAQLHARRERASASRRAPAMCRRSLPRRRRSRARCARARCVPPTGGVHFEHQRNREHRDRRPRRPRAATGARGGALVLARNAAIAAACTCR